MSHRLPSTSGYTPSLRERMILNPEVATFVTRPVVQFAGALSEVAMHWNDWSTNETEATVMGLLLITLEGLSIFSKSYDRSAMPTTNGEVVGDYLSGLSIAVLLNVLRVLGTQNMNLEHVGSVFEVLAVVGVIEMVRTMGRFASANRRSRRYWARERDVHDEIMEEEARDKAWEAEQLALRRTQADRVNSSSVGLAKRVRRKSKFPDLNRDHTETPEAEWVRGMHGRVRDAGGPMEAFRLELDRQVIIESHTPRVQLFPGWPLLNGRFGHMITTFLSNKRDVRRVVVRVDGVQEESATLEMDLPGGIPNAEIAKWIKAIEAHMVIDARREKLGMTPDDVMTWLRRDWEALKRHRFPVAWENPASNPED